MKNNIGWLVAVGLLVFNPARAEINLLIRPWDLYAASFIIGHSNSCPDVSKLVNQAAEVANQLCRKRPWA